MSLKYSIDQIVKKHNKNLNLKLVALKFLLSGQVGLLKLRNK